MVNGHRPISEKMKVRLGLQLGFSLEELGRIKSKTHGNSKLQAQQEIDKSYQPITIDVFHIISEPHHYGLLELIGHPVKLSGPEHS